jgi:deoxyribodipyrimidine photo-lyase
LVWFRGDLRLGDNPALAAAAARGGPVVPVYVLDDGAEGRWRPGAASRWWLHHSLGALDGSLRERGSRLVLARGGAGRELTRLSRACGAGAVYWNRRYEPAVLQRDRIVVADLAKEGLEARDFNSTLLFEPWSVANREGGPFQVFTPYWRRCLEIEVEAPRAPPRGVLARPAQWPASLALEELALLPAVRWYDGIAKAWQPGEKAAAARLRRFVPGALGSYAADRDRPDIAGTSMLSPCLHFGEVGPRQVWHALKAPSRESGVFPQSESARAFLRELGWREFAYHLLHHFPLTPERAHRQVFRGFPWARDPGGRKLSAWRKGLTGYPIVDAGMRQLWQTGWMHNRVRMIASSFLVKHLRVPWTEGARWFWNTLVDADLAKTRRHISGSSPPSSRPRGSTRWAPTCANGCPSSPGCRSGSSRGPGRRLSRSCARQACAWEPHTRGRSSITLRPGRGRSRPSGACVIAASHEACDLAVLKSKFAVRHGMLHANE